MSKLLGNFIEVVIPSTRMQEARVRGAIDNSIIDLGGCTLTEGRGFYVREDNGKVDAEHVITARWEYADDDVRMRGWQARQSALRVAHALLSSGEESVLVRGYTGGSYHSELMFA